MITVDHEQALWAKNFLIVGVDEAGRGALAGPVAAAAVVFHPQHVPAGLDDSKRLSASRRTELANIIRSSAMAWSVAFVHADRINAVNILQATFDAMHEAIDACMAAIDETHALHCLVDGNRFRRHRLPHTTIVGGDAQSPSIAAASILAKTTRDAWMCTADEQYPGYGFAVHKGYGTALHRAMLRELGPSAIHRTLFVRKALSAA